VRARIFPFPDFSRLCSTENFRLGRARAGRFRGGGARPSDFSRI
jgi:hypothetical protein